MKNTEDIINEFATIFAKQGIVFTEEEIKIIMNNSKTNKDPYEITKGDIWGIIDYLQEGLGNYIDNPGGRPYDDDEIININEWVQRCCAWLNQQIKAMP